MSDVSFTSFKLTRAKPADFGTIRSLHAQTMRDHRARETGFDVGREFIDPFLTKPRYFLSRTTYFFRLTKRELLVLEGDGSFLGYVAFSRTQWPKPNRVIFINDISILPQFRRKGIARKLLAEFETRVSGNSDLHVVAPVWKANFASRALFEDTGYTKNSSTPETQHRQLVIYEKHLGPQRHAPLFRFLNGLLLATTCFAALFLWMLANR
ncbi:hypothetical protein ACMU_05490 [Actibacterium mucosum KCTC 23349]|uniref:N-acetyltransferase domain-containing protein n=1 Tax=Actibacterium mucosum KCTC 23349 TaxID=1454373 RepID=A0A037ZLL7_9RHOB|nr:hypothetical protein ACMU_05490 [Actibacterium mucosum KCTC 23349]